MDAEERSAIEKKADELAQRVLRDGYFIEQDKNLPAVCTEALIEFLDFMERYPWLGAEDEQNDSHASEAPTLSPAA
jgi:hypothetical protein